MGKKKHSKRETREDPEKAFEDGFWEATIYRSMLQASELRLKQDDMNRQKRKRSRQAKEAASAPRKIPDEVIREAAQGLPDDRSLTSKIQRRLAARGIEISDKALRSRLYALDIKKR